MRRMTRLTRSMAKPQLVSCAINDEKTEIRTATVPTIRIDVTEGEIVSVMAKAAVEAVLVTGEVAVAL